MELLHLFVFKNINFVVKERVVLQVNYILYTKEKKGMKINMLVDINCKCF